MDKKPTYEELEHQILKLKNMVSRLIKTDEELRLNTEIISNMVEGIVLIDFKTTKIILANSRFEKMFGYGMGEMNGKDVSIVNAPVDKPSEETVRIIMNVIQKKGEWHGKVNNIMKDGTTFWCYANVSIFNHHRYGKVIISIHSDITDLKKKTTELNNTNMMLQEALANNKILSGLVPICARCKSILDDKGFWESIEKYIERNTDLLFTHRMCQKCEEELYGNQEWYKNNEHK